MSLPLISIITVAYNNKEGLLKTIESVLPQTFKNYEFVIVDGGSNDGSKELLNDYYENNITFKNQVGYFCSEPDNGIYNAMNKAIVKSKGSYLYFLNSGDILNDNKVLESIESSLTENQDCVVCGYVSLEDGTSFKPALPFKLASYYQHAIPHQASFISKSLFDKYGLYDESYKIISDYAFFFKSLIIGKEKFVYIDNCICKFDTTGVSSLQLEKSMNERRLFLQKELSPKEIELCEAYNNDFFEQIHIYNWINKSKFKFFIMFLLRLERKIRHLFGKKSVEVL